MRHATPTDLDRLAGLLEALRGIEGLKERTRGNFQLRSRAFLHFHAHGDDLFADVRLDGLEFERHRVTAPGEQAQLVEAIRRVI